MTDPAPSKVKVVVRIRPFVAKEVNKRCVVVAEKSSIELRQSPHAPALSYGFDGAYDSDSQQEDLFKNEIEPMIGSVFKGIHTTIFAYGITGAGKTFTMQGSDEQPGLIPRVARKVVSLAAQHTAALATKGTRASKCSVTVSYLEIYNEKVFDLLRPKTKDLPIREDTDKNIIIPDLAQLPVRSYEDFANTYAEGCKNRTVAPTSLNAHSSRSHAVLILTVKHRDGKRKYIGKLHLIDLAGSEDNRRTDNIGIRMTESSNINKSLFVLGKVVNALNDGSSRVPYRDSKLTRLLQDSLGGRSYGVMIANISPSINHYQDTFNTLNFASKSRQIINKPVVNTVDDEASRKALLEEYLELKKRMPGAAGKENRSNGNSAGGSNRRAGAKRRSSYGGAGGDGQKIDVGDLEAFIAQKTKEALEQRIKDMFGGGEVLKSQMENENFRMLKELERRLVETNKRHLEQCFDDDDEDEECGNSGDPAASNGNGDSKPVLLTPFTKVTTGVDIARRARKYANKGQYDRAIRYYHRLMKVMPEKEPSIRKKIAKLEARKRAQAATPVGASAIKERRSQHSTPFQPSSLSSLMQSLRLSENGKSKGKTLLTGPKKLSFDNCDGHNNASRAKGTPATRKTSASAERVGVEQRRRQQTPAAKVSSRPASARSMSLGKGATKIATAAATKRESSKASAETATAVMREKVRLGPSPAPAEAELTERKAEEVLRVDVVEVEREEEEEQQQEKEEEEEEEEEENNGKSSRHYWSESEEDDDGDDSKRDGDYLDVEVSSRQSARRSKKKADTDSEEDNDRDDGGIARDEGANEFEEDVLHVVNKGSMRDLLALHGIGKKRAEAIIDNRPFHRLAELKKIGLGEKLFEAFMKRNVWEVV